MSVVKLLQVPVRLLYLAVLIYYTVEGHEESYFESSGQLVSINYPNNYLDSHTCTYNIRSDGTAMTLTFVDFLTELNKDIVRVYDDENTLLETLSGNLSGHQVARAGDYYKLVFTTDNSIAYTGFSVTWTAFVCSYKFSGSSGIFTSPYYPNNYVDGLSCTYNILNKEPIILTFLEIDTESTNDQIKVANRYGTMELLEGIHTNVTISRASNDYRLQFNTDHSLMRKGFLATWTAYDCNADLNGSSGSVTSPYYPSSYVDGLSCTWTIDGGSTMIRLTFDDFITQRNKDFVKVYDKNNTLLAKLTGERSCFMVKPATYYKLTFETNYRLISRGFNASWTEASSTPQPIPFIFTHGTCIQAQFYIAPTTGLSLTCLGKYVNTNFDECLQKCLQIAICTGFEYVDNICGFYKIGMGGKTMGSKIWKRG